MARSTWGSILEKKKGPDGIYLLRYTVNGKAKSETVRGSRSDADRRLAELRIKYEGGIGENPVLCVFWDIVYHPWLKSNLAPKTVDGGIESIHFWILRGRISSMASRPNSGSMSW